MRVPRILLVCLSVLIHATWLGRPAAQADASSGAAFQAASVDLRTALNTALDRPNDEYQYAVVGAEKTVALDSAVAARHRRDQSR